MAHFDSTTSEVWYPVPGFSGYEVSSRFRVRSWWRKGGKRNKRTETPTLLSVWTMKAGYLAFGLRRDGRRVIVYMHHVVAELAHGPRPEGLDVLHRDDVKANNDPSNLYYGTESENTFDRHRNGRAPLGGARTQAKIDEAGACTAPAARPRRGGRTGSTGPACPA